MYASSYNIPPFEGGLAKGAGYNGGPFAPGRTSPDTQSRMRTGPQQVPIQPQRRQQHPQHSLPSPVPAMYMPGHPPRQLSLSRISPLPPTSSVASSHTAMPTSQNVVPASAITRIRTPNMESGGLSPLPSFAIASSSGAANVQGGALASQGAVNIAASSNDTTSSMASSTETASAGQRQSAAMDIRQQSTSTGTSTGDNNGAGSITGTSVTNGGVRRRSKVRATAMCRRRRASDLARDFWCPEGDCRRRYEAWRSLQHHLRADHGVPMRLREYKTIRHARGQDLLVDSRGMPIIMSSPTGSSDPHDSGDNSGNDNELRKSSVAAMATSLPARAASDARSLLASLGDSIDNMDDDDDDDILGHDVSSMFPTVLSESDESMDYYPPRLSASLPHQQRHQQQGDTSSRQPSRIDVMAAALVGIPPQRDSRSRANDADIDLGDVEFPDLWQSLSADLSRSFIHSPEHHVLLRGPAPVPQQNHHGNGGMGRGQNTGGAYPPQPSLAIQNSAPAATPMSDLWSFLAGPYPEPLDDISSLLPV